MTEPTSSTSIASHRIADPDHENLPRPPGLRPLGPGGPSVSALSWGMWRFAGLDLRTAEELVNAVLEAGITLFDTADIYGYKEAGGFGSAEVLLGEVFRRDPGLRGKIVLATKGGIRPPLPYDSSAVYLTAAIEASLQRLGVEHVELWQIHRPDILTHPAEIARALEEAHKAGKIGAVGISNFTPAQITTLQAFLQLKIVSTQPQLSALHIDPIVNGELDQAIRENLCVLAWSPLGGGRLTAPKSEREQAVAARLAALGEERGVSLSAMAYSWIMAHPAHPIPIIGTQNLARVKDAASALDVTWTRAEWYGVYTLARGERLP